MRNRPVIYIKNTKTAGTSVVEFFRESMYTLSYRDIVENDFSLSGCLTVLTSWQISRFRDQYPGIWDEAYRFSTVRNPYSRFVSGWKYHPRTKNIWSAQVMMENLPQVYISPLEVNYKAERPKYEWPLYSAYNHVTSTQSETLVQDEKLIVHRILRVENLRRDLKKLCSDIGLKPKCKLKCLNRTSWRKTSMKKTMSHFSSVALHLFNDHFRDDFSYLGYEMR